MLSSVASFDPEGGGRSAWWMMSEINTRYHIRDDQPMWDPSTPMTPLCLCPFFRGICIECYSIPNQLMASGVSWGSAGTGNEAQVHRLHAYSLGKCEPYIYTKSHFHVKKRGWLTTSTTVCGCNLGIESPCYKLAVLLSVSNPGSDDNDYTVVNIVLFWVFRRRQCEVWERELENIKK